MKYWLELKVVWKKPLTKLLHFVNPHSRFQSSRCFIPICGHFGNLPAILSSAHDADTGHEALDNLAAAFAEISPIDSPNHREHFLEGILESLPQLVPLTQHHAKIEIECALEVKFSIRNWKLIYVRLDRRGGLRIIRVKSSFCWKNISDFTIAENKSTETKQRLLLFILPSHWDSSLER